MESWLASLSVWQDLNVNGTTDHGEFRSLADAGISSLSLRYKNIDKWQNDNFIGEASTALRDGREVQLADIYFRVGKGDLQRPHDILVQSMAGFDALKGGGQVAPIDTNLLQANSNAFMMS
jgi:hypothetical protein